MPRSLAFSKVLTYCDINLSLTNSTLASLESKQTRLPWALAHLSLAFVDMKSSLQALFIKRWVITIAANILGFIIGFLTWPLLLFGDEACMQGDDS